MFHIFHVFSPFLTISIENNFKSMTLHVNANSTQSDHVQNKRLHHFLIHCTMPLTIRDKIDKCAGSKFYDNMYMYKNKN